MTLTVAAEAPPDVYKLALETLVPPPQHKVAATATRSYVQTSKLGRPLDVPNAARHSASDFQVEAPEDGRVCIDCVVPVKNLDRGDLFLALEKQKWEKSGRTCQKNWMGNQKGTQIYTQVP